MSEPLLPNRVRIESNGEACDTRITNADTGEEIACTRVVIEFDAKEQLSKASLEVTAPVVDMVCEAEEMKSTETQVVRLWFTEIDTLELYLRPVQLGELMDAMHHQRVYELHYGKAHWMINCTRVQYIESGEV